jgi:hypothetical protein
MTFPVNYEDTPSAKTGLELLPTTQQVSHMKKDLYWLPLL